MPETLQPLIEVDRIATSVVLDTGIHFKNPMIMESDGKMPQQECALCTYLNLIPSGNTNGHICSVDVPLNKSIHLSLVAEDSVSDRKCDDATDVTKPPKSTCEQDDIDNKPGK